MFGLHTLLRSSRLDQHFAPQCAALLSLCKHASPMPETQMNGAHSARFYSACAIRCLDSSKNSATKQFSTTANAANELKGGFTSTSINQEEVSKFAQLANEWWDPHGAFRPLHAMNPTRCKFIRDALCQRFSVDALQPEPFKGKTFLDVGCGGGILSEALARMGATVTGIEPQQDNIKAAVAHAQSDPVLADRVTYLAITAEEMASTGKQFDAVMGLEIIEHVEQPAAFMKTLTSLTKSDGALFISTINRTPRGYLLAILGAEYIAGVLPKGTHDWHKFLTPEELYMLSEDTGLDLQQVAGMVMDPMTGSWALSTSVAVNYIAYFSKVSLQDRLNGSMQVSTSKAADLASV